MLRSNDLKVWEEMEVDYRAVAQRAVIAAPDAKHMWVATDTGMILTLADAEAASRLARLNNPAGCLFYPHFVHSGNLRKSIESMPDKSFGKRL